MRAYTVPTLSGNDYTYQAGLLFIWTGAEVASTIVAASIPILRVLVSELKHSRYPGVAPLNTFKSMADGGGGGIHVTKETIVSRSLSNAHRERKSSLDDGDELLKPSPPTTPMPTYHYHSYVQA